MRNVAIIIISALIGAIALAGVMSIAGRSGREVELNASLPGAVEEAVTELLAEKTYDIADREQFLADLVSDVSRLLDSNCDITVNVVKADTEKGVLSVLVQADFLHPNGKPGSVSCERTVIFNQMPEV